MSYKLIESMRLIASTDPIDAALDPQRAVRVAHEALAADDAARGTMREEFEAWAEREGWPTDYTPDAECGVEGGPVYRDPRTHAAWWGYREGQAATRAAVPPASSPLGRDADWALAMAEALGTDSGFEVPIVPEAEAFRRLFAAVRAAAPQSVEPVVDNDDELPGMWSHSDLIGGATDCVTQQAAPTDAAWRAENERLRVALRFYARGEHYNLDESEEFDTVSGEPENWLCSGVEDSSTMIENGRVALFALRGIEANWIDGDEDCTPQPVEGEKALRAHLSTRPAQAEEWIACSERMPNPDFGEVLVWLWESKMYAIDEWHTYHEDPTGMGGPTLDMGLMWRNFDFDEVSHWRPLPAPPTKAKEQ